MAVQIENLVYPVFSAHLVDIFKMPGASQATQLTNFISRTNNLIKEGDPTSMFSVYSSILVFSKAWVTTLFLEFLR